MLALAVKSAIAIDVLLSSRHMLVVLLMMLSMCSSKRLKASNALQKRAEQRNIESSCSQGCTHNSEGTA